MPFVVLLLEYRPEIGKKQMRRNGNTVMCYRKAAVFPGIFNIFVGVAPIRRADVHQRKKCRQFPCFFLCFLNPCHCFKFGRVKVPFSVIHRCQVYPSNSSKLPKVSPADASATRGRSNAGNGCCSIHLRIKSTASFSFSFGIINVSSS